MSGTFIEVGSCDFDNLDALLLDNWTGHFVEPVPVYLYSLINKVRTNTRGKNVKAFYHNCAISNFTGAGSITYIPPGTGDWWLKGIGHVTGFNNNAIQSRKDELKLHNKEEKITIQFYTLDDFLNRNNINDIEIMKIDTEGHELKILENYSWRVKPRHIKIEYTWVGKENIISILTNAGYSIEFDDEDVYGTYYE